jgi:hypothetical protein
MSAPAVQRLRLYVDANYASPYAMSVFVALREKALDFDIVTLDLGTGAHHSPDFAGLSLTHRIPTLVDGTFALSLCHLLRTEQRALVPDRNRCRRAPVCGHRFASSRRSGKFVRIVDHRRHGRCPDAQPPGNEWGRGPTTAGGIRPEAMATAYRANLGENESATSPLSLRPALEACPERDSSTPELSEFV